jgi:hypothetical protein
MTAAVPHASNITILQTLALLDGPFSEMAAGVADDSYAVWLGSGISLSRMPGLKKVVVAVLDHLQSNCANTDITCPYRTSLDEILKLAPLSNDEWSRIDYMKSVADWLDIDVISDRLIGNYSKMLDQAPQGLPLDYLVWDAVDVVGRYGDPTIEPDVEHLAMAALILEGVASDVASANWDALVEKAVEKIAGIADPLLLQVRVRPEDTRFNAARARLYKFHGCAVLAGQDEANYRSRLVGRASQINGWVQKGEFRVIAEKLIDLARSKPTVMLGLSAQDTNIQAIFVAAKEQMPWNFPSHPPAYVFSENNLGADQKGLLQNVYNLHYAANQQGIAATALLRAYASSLLPALWLHVIWSKLCSLACVAGHHLSQDEQTTLQLGLRELRDKAADPAKLGEHAQFIERALTLTGRAMGLVRNGRPPTRGHYSPVTGTSRAASLADPFIPSSGIGGFALGLGLLGEGQRQGLWLCAIPQAVDAKDGIVAVKSPARAAHVFFAANTEAAAQMVLNGHVCEDDDAILIHSHSIPVASQRSPSSAPGRTGKLGLQEISIARLVAGSPKLPDLLANLKAEMCL